MNIYINFSSSIYIKTLEQSIILCKVTAILHLPEYNDFISKRVKALADKHLRVDIHPRFCRPLRIILKITKALQLNIKSSKQLLQFHELILNLLQVNVVIKQ